MSNLSAQDFVSKLATDPNFRSQIGISANMSLDEFRDKAAAAGFSYTSEEILAAAESQQSGVLSENDLDDVSGGAVNKSKIGPLVNRPVIRFPTDPLL